MQELQKMHRVDGQETPGAPHETLLVLDATTGMNALKPGPANSTRPSNSTGLVVTKLDGTSKGGMVVAIQRELALPIKFIGLGEKGGPPQPFDAKQFARRCFRRRNSQFNRRKGSELSCLWAKRNSSCWAFV
jgi:fused signal recognition particle receptor